MIVLKALLGLVLGAVCGVVLFVGLSYPLFLAAAGGRDMNGGIAMGMVTGMGPLGLVVGAIAGLAYILVRHTARPSTEASEKPAGKRGLIVVGIIALLAFGYIGLLLYLQGPAKISMETEPDLHFEFRTAASSLVTTDDFTPHVELFGHADNTIIPIPTTTRVEGDTAYLSGKLHVQKGKGYENMRVRAWFSPNLIVDATMPLWPGSEVVPGLTEWDAVDFIKMPISGETELGYSQDVHMSRYEVRPHGE